MKTPERFPPDDPREWLNRARSNLALAKNRIPGAYLEDLCFEAQQAAEKSLKAVMVLRSIQFPFVQDLSRLVSMIEKEGVEVPEVLLRAEKLTIYAVMSCEAGYRTGVP
ncbi:MAG: HEPN domain-containing protein [Caldilineaceae bacterium]|nr:HEPN domain-containing protein [Caldilineaceae bacterium]